MKPGPVLIGLGYLVVVLFIIGVIAAETSSFEEFSQYWGIFGALIGVATGAIPAYFFKTTADEAIVEARKATEEAIRARESARAATERLNRFELAADGNSGPPGGAAEPAASAE